MTRAKADPEDEDEEFGHRSRAYVRKLRYRSEQGSWQGIRAWQMNGPICHTWAEAMAYALGNDTKETKE